MAVDILVLGLVVVVLTVVVYALATLGTKETPYEEALAEQRQKQEQENAQTKPEKQYKYKKDKYQVKKRAPVRKDGAETNDSAAEASAEEVVIEPEAKKKKEVAQRKVVESVVVKAEAPKVENAKGKSPKVEAKKEQTKAAKVEAKKEQAKPAKVEAKKEPAKAAKVEVKEEPLKVTKVETKQAKPSKPEAKKEVKAEPAKTEAAKGKAAKAEEAKVEPVVEKPKPQRTEAKEESPKVDQAKASPESTPPPPAKENKKEKSASAAAQTNAEETPDVVDSPVVSTGKATPTQEKKKKKDKPAAATQQNKLLPMVQCAGLSSGEIQTYIDILLNEQQRSNAGGEWVSKGRVDPITQLRRQLEDVESQLKEKDEAHSALSAKITSLRTELNGERSRSTKLKTQLEETVANHTKQLETATTSAQATQAATIKELKATLETEYQEKLQQQQTILQQLQTTQNDGELATLRSSLTEAEMQAAVLKQERDELNMQYKEHIRGLEEKWATENDMRNAQFTELQGKVTNLDAQRAQALSEASQVNMELATEKTRTAQIQHNLQEAVQEKARIEARLGQVEGELDGVQQVVLDQTAQIERLKEEKESLASQSVRPAAEGQENGDIHAEQAQGPTTAELDLIVKERENQIEQQLTEVSNLKKEITRLREDLDSQKAKNNEASGEVEEEKTKVRAVLRRICPEVVVDDALDQGAFLSEFEAKALQVITQSSQTPQPEVVEVEKVVEKVIEVEKIVEKIVEDESLKAKVEELLSENSQLKTQVEELKSSVSAADDSKRVSELEEEVRTVGEKVVHYQTVLADTENLLKSLQASVESEEVTWNKRLSEKDLDIRQLTADKANLELQVKQYESTLDKVKEAEEAAAEDCGLEFALKCIEKSLPLVVTQMQTQLKQMQEQLQSESKDKAALQEELLKAQEQLTQTATKNASMNGPAIEEQSPEGAGAKE